MSATTPTPIGFRFCYKRRGETNTWGMIKGVRDTHLKAPGPWGGPCAWRDPGEGDDRQALIYAAVTPTGEQDPSNTDDLDDLCEEAEWLADAKLRELYPGATIIEG